MATTFYRPKSEVTLVAPRRLLLLFLLPAFALSAPPPDWQPLSSTAMTITGPIALSNTRLTMVHHTFPLQSPITINAAHLAAAAKIADFAGSPSSAALFKLNIPASTKLLNTNTICGPTQASTWLLAVFGPDSLSLAFFSGTSKPPMDANLISQGHDLCGTFSYTRAK